VPPASLPTLISTRTGPDRRKARWTRREGEKADHHGTAGMADGELEGEGCLTSDDTDDKPAVLCLRIGRRDTADVVYMLDKDGNRLKPSVHRLHRRAVAHGPRCGPRSKWTDAKNGAASPCWKIGGSPSKRGPGQRRPEADPVRPLCNIAFKPRVPGGSGRKS